ncbi:MAG: response regulator [Saprospiraceae bacterium]|jgi:CheY-like chemotaxis protein|nr:response regulator [Saprospiraceae bacterium]
MNKRLDCFLLIDDNEADNVYHEIIIEEAGCVKEVISVQSGKDGLELLMGNKEEAPPAPNIIFLDINMPGMNGWEFLDEYQKLHSKNQADIIIIMLTTSLNPDDRKRAEKIEAIKDFKTKPLTTNMLKEILEKHF